MTQQPQDEFDMSVENAEAWMKAIQERLRINDNTKGPRSALEARLRETEKICALEPEGRVKMDLVLIKADALLRCISEEEKHEILAKLKDIKAMWEETAIYITHCHSRIEWVWLHWSEYLKAQDEFYVWIHNMKVTLEPDIELQLGLKEKQWQLSHSQVLLNDVLNQSVLLERLLEEAASLFNRIGDPSVDEDVQKKMKVEYEEIKTEAQCRVKLLEKITKEHEQYKTNVDQFQSWLNGVTERLNSCLGETTKLPADNGLKTLQNIAKDVKRGEKKLKCLEVQSTGVIQNTSPLGAGKMKDELEELRKALEKLKLICGEEEERIHKILKSESAFQSQARQLEAEVQEFRKMLQRLENDLESEEKPKSEEELVALWRKYIAARAALAAEEPKAERLKAQLKELFRFSQNIQPLSDGVVAAIREYQRAKGKTFKMSTGTETELGQSFQNPLREFQLWKPSAQRLLDSTANVAEPSLTHAFLLQIEECLAESSQFKEQLMMLQLKKDLLSSIFGEERAKSLLAEVTDTAKEREILHKSLLQRKSRLQSLVTQHKDFDAGFVPLQKKLSAIRAKVDLENEPQPDHSGKERRLQRLQMIQEELAEFIVQMEELQNLVHSNPTDLPQMGLPHKDKMNQLSSDYQTLKRSLEIILAQTEKHIQEHWTFNNKLSDLQGWITMTEQKLESYQDARGERNTESRIADLEGLLAEFPDKEIQLHLVGAHGQLVIESSSPEGAAHVHTEMNQLTESLRSLKKMTTSLLSSMQPNTTVVDTRKSITIMGNTRTTGFAFGSSEVTLKRSQSSKHLKCGVQGSDPYWVIRKHIRHLQFGKIDVGAYKSHTNQWKSLSQTHMYCFGYETANVSKEEENSHLLKLMKDFEQWLHVENAKLSKILVTKPSSCEEVKAIQSKLKELQSRVPEGQCLFEDLLSLQTVVGTSEDVEDLRYQWMLYKSKLKNSSSSLTPRSLEEPDGFRKVQNFPIIKLRNVRLEVSQRRPGGMCPFLHRVCWAALPLQILLLFLLLLAFLLPLVEETHSCKLANNFARSFNLMLRYEGPPPT
ncbi:Nesprin-3 [Chelonia mydas]|uniref:Nesprin-3 n=1 Tax=Chelonia mydas TaxID=8469 RepID=M7BS87_CHEMY|nr:Nesprin-3 [Chelonia mydas]